MTRHSYHGSNVHNPHGHRAISAPSELPDHLMRFDFHGYGFTDGEVQEMLAFKEPVVDAYTQISHGRYTRDKRNAEKVLQKLKSKKEKRESRAQKEVGAYGGQGGGKRQQIYLDRKKKWVLFDPIRGWPPTMDSSVPNVYMRYSRYQTGNAKVVAYNVESCAVALMSVPQMLKGAEVLYQKAGPKAIKAKREEEGTRAEE